MLFNGFFLREVLALHSMLNQLLTDGLEALDALLAWRSQIFKQLLVALRRLDLIERAHTVLKRDPGPHFVSPQTRSLDLDPAAESLYHDCF